MRMIVLDTETTGLEIQLDHRIIEIGCVELVNRRPTTQHFHRYVNPGRDIDPGAMEVHGISNEDLADKPLFAQVADDFLAFVQGAELVIHNAPFDVGFINHELGKLGGAYSRIEDHCGIVDTLTMARQLFPGQKNSLNALCKRYGVDNSQRQLHGALLDAEILAEVYLHMTGGQAALTLGGSHVGAGRLVAIDGLRRLDGNRPRLKVIQADASEVAAHRHNLAMINQASGGKCLWVEGQSDG